jgi:hypothetical protein
VTQTEEDTNKLRSKTSKTVTSKLILVQLLFKKNIKIFIIVTSANPTLISSSVSSDKFSTTFKPPIKEYDEDYEGPDEDDDMDEDEEYDDYHTSAPEFENKAALRITTTEPSVEITETELDDTTVRVFTQKSPNQKQVAVVASPEGKPLRLVQTQNGKTFTYPPKQQRIDEFQPPEDAHDVTISKTTQKIKYKTRYLPSTPEDENALNKKSLKDENFVSITNSLSGNVDDTGDGKFESTYITKTSKCGHVTFSCNVVYGSEGRSRICRPKQPNTKC